MADKRAPKLKVSPNVPSIEEGQTKEKEMASTTPAKRINFNNIGQPIDPGEYTVRLETHNWKPDKNGNDRMNLTMVIEDDERYAGKKLFSGYSPDGDAAYYMMDALVQFGVDPDELMNIGEDEDGDEESDRASLDAIIKTAYGAKARVVVGHTQGKDRNGNDRIYANVTSIKSI